MMLWCKGLRGRSGSCWTPPESFIGDLFSSKTWRPSLPADLTTDRPYSCAVLTDGDVTGGVVDALPPALTLSSAAD